MRLIHLCLYLLKRIDFYWCKWWFMIWVSSNLINFIWGCEGWILRFSEKDRFLLLNECSSVCSQCKFNLCLQCMSFIKKPFQHVSMKQQHAIYIWWDKRIRKTTNKLRLIDTYYKLGWNVIELNLKHVIEFGCFWGKQTYIISIAIACWIQVFYWSISVVLLLNTSSCFNCNSLLNTYIMILVLLVFYVTYSKKEKKVAILY